MELTIDRDELLAGLQLSQGVVERRTTIPILANVLIEGEGNAIVISATDQEIGIRRHCEAKVKKKGALTTGARKLFEIVRECAAGPVKIASLENNWITVSSGNSRFKIVGLDPKEFPAMPASSGDQESQSLTLPSSLLIEMIEKTLFAVSTDETRLNLSGILFERPEAGKLRLVATDGHRLSMVTRTVEGISQGEGVIIPRKGVSEISKVIESVEEPIRLTIQGGVVHLTQGPVELSMRLIEGEFPEYGKVVPKKSAHHMEVPAESFLAALRRVSVVSSERTRGVKLAFSNKALEVSSINPDLGEASEELEVDYEGDELEVGFNARYFVDALVVIGSGTVDMGFTDEESPGVLRRQDDDDFLYVVMPMRL